MLGICCVMNVGKKMLTLTLTLRSEACSEIEEAMVITRRGVGTLLRMQRDECSEYIKRQDRCNETPQ